MADFDCVANIVFVGGRVCILYFVSVCVRIFYRIESKFACAIGFVAGRNGLFGVFNWYVESIRNRIPIAFGVGVAEQGGDFVAGTCSKNAQIHYRVNSDCGRDFNAARCGVANIVGVANVGFVRNKYFIYAR